MAVWGRLAPCGACDWGRPIAPADKGPNREGQVREKHAAAVANQVPLLADYLEEGLEQLGISSEDAEGEVL